MNRSDGREGGSECVYAVPQSLRSKVCSTVASIGSFAGWSISDVLKHLMIGGPEPTLRVSEDVFGAAGVLERAARKEARRASFRPASG